MFPYPFPAFRLAVVPFLHLTVWQREWSEFAFEKIWDRDTLTGKD